MHRKDISRRQFIAKTAAIAGGILMSPVAAQAATYAPKRTAADQMTLGRTGIKLSRLGIGTGTRSGNVQRALGQDGFTKLVRYAYDQGITYIDTAEAYRTHGIVGEAIKGLPREKLFIQSKMPGVSQNPLEVLDRYRRELGVEYIDSLLVHCVLEGNWDDSHKRVLDALQEAKDKQIIRAHGVSCHTLPALKRAVLLDWVDVHLVRVNPQGVMMDTADESWNARSDTSDVPAVMEQLKLMREKKRGVIGMKLIGEGRFVDPEEREKAIRFVMQSDVTDAVVIGFKSEAEIDEAIARINSALAVTA